jgi:uncharacterized protein YbaP (TraB family)
MDLRSLLAIMLLTWTPACWGQVKAPLPGVSAEARTAYRDQDLGGGAGSIWVADREGQPGRLFLCGTIHILRDRDYPLSPGYEAVYKLSDQLVLELPPGSGTGPAMASRMRELGMYSSDTSLEANVTAETWMNVKTWAAAHSVEVSSLNRFRPWFVSLIITSTEYAALGARPDLGVDQHFENRAKQEGKAAEGLETVEFQLQLFSQLTHDQQKNMLEQTLAEVATMSQEFEKMIQAWKDGRLDALHEMLFREAERYPELMNLFLKNRNLQWIGRLDEMLKNGVQAMVLVGTGHLASKDGIIQLLKNRGYRVRHHREVSDL